MNSLFQVQPQIPNWIDMWFLTQPLQDITIAVFNLFRCSFDYIIRCIVLQTNPNGYDFCGRNGNFMIMLFSLSFGLPKET